MGNKADLPRVQYPVLRFGKGRTGDLHFLRSRLDAGAALAIKADRAPPIEALSPTPPLAAEVERIESNGKESAFDPKRTLLLFIDQARVRRTGAAYSKRALIALIIKSDRLTISGTVSATRRPSP